MDISQYYFLIGKMSNEWANYGTITEKELDEKKQELIDNLTIERIAEILYYCLYVPDEHPKAELYEEMEDWIQVEMPELSLLTTLELMVLISEKLEKTNHHKFIFFRNFIDFALSPYYSDCLPKSVDVWFCDSYHRLSQNPGAHLKPFPLNDWYQIEGNYNGSYIPKPRYQRSKWYHG